MLAWVREKMRDGRKAIDRHNDRAMSSFIKTYLRNDWIRRSNDATRRRNAFFAEEEARRNARSPSEHGTYLHALRLITAIQKTGEDWVDYVDREMKKRGLN